MGLIETVRARLSGIDVAAVAEAVRVRVEEAGPPPVVGRLAPRERGAFERLARALRALPRPVATAGLLALVGAAVVAPDWIEGRLAALGRLPEAVWWLAGALLGLQGVARAQDRAETAQRDAVADAVGAVLAPPPPRAGTPAVAAPGPDAALLLGTLATGPNAAVAEWLATKA